MPSRSYSNSEIIAVGCHSNIGIIRINMALEVLFSHSISAVGLSFMIRFSLKLELAPATTNPPSGVALISRNPAFQYSYTGVMVFCHNESPLRLTFKMALLFLK